MCDIAFLCERRNDEKRNSRVYSELIQLRRSNVIIETTEIVVPDEHNTAIPVGSLHDGVDLHYGPGSSECRPLSVISNVFPAHNLKHDVI